jgi:hypothetical protein
MKTAASQEHANETSKICMIAGYLEAIQVWANYQATEVEHHYFFEQNPRMFEDMEAEVFHYLRGHAQGEWPDRAFGSLAKTEYELQPIQQWEQQLPAILSDWVASPGPNWERNNLSYPPKGLFMAEGLRDLLVAYFGENKPKAYLLKGTFSDALYYEWGGVSYLDVFFERNEDWFVLHFDSCD